MKFHTNLQYAVIALVEIAKNNHEKPVSLPKLAEKLGLSLPYLEQIFRHLRKYELVESYRGINGGYVLKKKYEKITIYDIAKALDTSKPTSTCKWVEFAKENAASNCLGHNLWINLDKKMNEVFYQFTLADILNNTKH